LSKFHCNIYSILFEQERKKANKNERKRTGRKESEQEVKKSQQKGKKANRKERKRTGKKESEQEGKKANRKERKRTRRKESEQEGKKANRKERKQKGWKESEQEGNKANRKERKRTGTKRKEYISEWNLLEKSVKRPFCCTVSILQVYFIFVLYNLSGPGRSFYRKSKINIKRNPNFEIRCMFHN